MANTSLADQLAKARQMQSALAANAAEMAGSSLASAPNAKSPAKYPTFFGAGRTQSTGS